MLHLNDWASADEQLPEPNRQVLITTRQNSKWMAVAHTRIAHTDIREDDIVYDLVMSSQSCGNDVGIYWTYLDDGSIQPPK